LAYLRARRLRPARYVGLEAQGWLVDAARRQRLPGCTIVQADFVRQPQTMEIGADVVVFSGSLNLLPSRLFYRCLPQAWAATGRWLAFNFLSSPELTGDPWLHWHRTTSVVAFAEALPGAARVWKIDDYEPGDCTVVVRKSGRLGPRPGLE